MRKKKIVKIILIVIISAVVLPLWTYMYLFHDSINNPETAFFTRNVRKDCQEYLDKYLGEGIARVDYIAWNKHDRFGDSAYYVRGRSVEDKFIFMIYLDKENKPLKTDYYGELFSRKAQLKYETKASEIFEEEASCAFRAAFSVVDISDISEMPEVSELYEKSATVPFHFKRNYSDTDDENIEKIIDYISKDSIKYKIWSVSFYFLDKKIDRDLRS
ncbi:MAG: hypothetical protein LBL35_01320 [Clostridiales bacterium]|jgi:hypothetical protein|nr:hypothetical protein [Clostridiales bacterium]